MKLPVLLAVVALSFSAPAAVTYAQDDTGNVELPVAETGPNGRVRVGLLECQIDGAIGLIIGSSRDVACTFQDRITETTEFYEGTLSRLGLDIGFTGDQYMRWVVFAPSAAVVSKGFAGRYVGVSAEGALGLSFGANALLGGSNESFVLQPFSVQIGSGLNLALGASTLVLGKSV